MHEAVFHDQSVLEQLQHLAESKLYSDVDLAIRALVNLREGVSSIQSFPKQLQSAIESLSKTEDTSCAEIGKLLKKDKKYTGPLMAYTEFNYIWNPTEPHYFREWLSMVGRNLLVIEYSIARWMLKLPRMNYNFHGKMAAWSLLMVSAFSAVSTWRMFLVSPFMARQISDSIEAQAQGKPGSWLYSGYGSKLFHFGDLLGIALGLFAWRHCRFGFFLLIFQSNNMGSLIVDLCSKSVHAKINVWKNYHFMAINYLKLL